MVLVNPFASAGDKRNTGSIPRLGRSPGEGNGNPLQYSCLENPMDRGAWEATVHAVAKSLTRLSDFTSLHFSIFTWEMPWTEEPGRATVHGVPRVKLNLVTKIPPAPSICLSVCLSTCIYMYLYMYIYLYIYRYGASPVAQTVKPAM